MRHNTSNRRSRGRNNKNKNGGGNRTQVFDSNGPEVRIRGTAFQICEKYEALAKDARSTGDVVLAESYLQHAEHYQRMIVTWNDKADSQQNQNNQSQNKTYNTKNNNEQKDDLALPNSILGDEVKVKSNAAEKVLETA